MKLKYPQRSETHVKETESERLLHSLAPREWIIRQISERDYGIDIYVEIATQSGEITGDLIFIQLKSVNTIQWKERENIDRGKSPQIKTTTAAYLFNLPVPVFIFVADISKQNIYYIPVKQQIRKIYNKLTNQDSITFDLVKVLDLKSEIGMSLFKWHTSIERMHKDFSFHVNNFLSNLEIFGEFILDHQWRDCHLPVEGADLLRFISMYQTCNFISSHLYKEWKVDSLENIFSSDKLIFNDPDTLVHELSLNKVMKQIEPIFIELAKGCINLVSNVQSEYWKQYNFILYCICKEQAIDVYINQFEKDYRARCADVLQIS